MQYEEIIAKQRKIIKIAGSGVASAIVAAYVWLPTAIYAGAPVPFLSVGKK